VLNGPQRLEVSPKRPANDVSSRRKRLYKLAGLGGPHVMSPAASLRAARARAGDAAAGAAAGRGGRGGARCLPGDLRRCRPRSARPSCSCRGPASGATTFLPVTCTPLHQPPTALCHRPRAIWSPAVRPRAACFNSRSAQLPRLCAWGAAEKRLAASDPGQLWVDRNGNIKEGTHLIFNVSPDFELHGEGARRPALPCPSHQLDLRGSLARSLALHERWCMRTAALSRR